MKKIALFLICCLSFFYYFCFWRLPATKPTNIKPLEPTTTAALVPLDSRPVCTRLPQQIAHLAGTNLRLPPASILDQYRKPAAQAPLLAWLTVQSQQYPASIYAAADMLLSGGLIASRKQSQNPQERQALLQQLKALSAKQKQTSWYYFSLIPRLLVSNELIPDCWYQFHLQKYSQLYHIAQELNDYPATTELQYYTEKIPAEILTKYKSLYQENFNFNCQLLTLTDNATIVIGQDDGSPWGLPSLSYQQLEAITAKNKQVHMTYGADEIASMLIARDYLSRKSLRPRIALHYAHPSIPSLYMPYQATNVDNVLQEKINFLNAEITDNEDKADLILYVNCGHDSYRPSKNEAQQLQELLQAKKPVALIDLSANFEENELLMPLLLQNNVPIMQLTAYAGWNTFSNSAGTVLPEALIFLARQNESNNTQRLALHKERADLLCRHFLDDYAYQKQFHARLKTKLLGLNIEPTDLQPKEKAYAQALANSFVRSRARELLHQNLGQMPFYQDDNHAYYLTQLDVKTTFPWSRIFEVQLEITTKVGQTP